jgi:pre-rRNA-processing protein IPI1
MPKGHKRKNTGVGVDFKRAKHKVGKKLPQAQNATDTTIVSRSIALKEQSIAVDKTGAVVTHRNLTLKVRIRTSKFPSPVFFKQD